MCKIVLSITIIVSYTLLYNPQDVTIQMYKRVKYFGKTYVNNCIKQFYSYSQVRHAVPVDKQPKGSRSYLDNGLGVLPVRHSFTGVFYK